MAKPRPSEKFNKFVQAYGSVNAAAEAWNVEYQSLNRFLKGEGGLSLATAMTIAQATGVSMDSLFDLVPGKDEEK